MILIWYKSLQRSESVAIYCVNKQAFARFLIIIEVKKYFRNIGVILGVVFYELVQPSQT